MRFTIFNPIGLRVAPVIEQHTPATNAMVAPMVDRALMLILVWSVNVRASGTVVELALLEEGDVSEPVPLCAALGVEDIDVVVG